jgi:hypothetical protein
MRARLDRAFRARLAASRTIAGLAVIAGLFVIARAHPAHAQTREASWEAPTPLGSFVVGRWIERHPDVRGLVHIAHGGLRLVAIEGEVGLTFCARRERPVSIECRLERGARLVPGPPRRWRDAADRGAIGLVVDGPRGTLELILSEHGLAERSLDDDRADAIESSRELRFEPPWPRTPEASDARAPMPPMTPARGERASMPAWISPMLRRGLAAEAFVVARRDGRTVQVVHGLSSEGHETSLLLVHEDGAWLRGRVRPSTVHGARFLDALAPGAIGVLELESIAGSSLDVPMEARAFLLVVQPSGRSVASLGQLAVGGVTWTRFSPEQSDVARWFYAARVEAPGRVVLTLDHAYAGVFDRRVSGFVGTTRAFDPTSHRRRDGAGAGARHGAGASRRDLGGTYVLGPRGFTRTQ